MEPHHGTDDAEKDETRRNRPGWSQRARKQWESQNPVVRSRPDPPRAAEGQYRRRSYQQPQPGPAQSNQRPQTTGLSSQSNHQPRRQSQPQPGIDRQTAQAGTNWGGAVDQIQSNHYQPASHQQPMPEGQASPWSHGTDAGRQTEPGGTPTDRPRSEGGRRESGFSRHPGQRADGHPQVSMTRQRQSTAAQQPTRSTGAPPAGQRHHHEVSGQQSRASEQPPRARGGPQASQTGPPSTRPDSQTPTQHRRGQRRWDRYRLADTHQSAQQAQSPTESHGPAGLTGPHLTGESTREDERRSDDSTDQATDATAADGDTLPPRDPETGQFVSE